MVTSLLKFGKHNLRNRTLFKLTTIDYFSRCLTTGDRLILLYPTRKSSLKDSDIFILSFSELFEGSCYSFANLLIRIKYDGCPHVGNAGQSRHLFSLIKILVRDLNSFAGIATAVLM